MRGALLLASALLAGCSASTGRTAAETLAAVPASRVGQFNVYFEPSTSIITSEARQLIASLARAITARNGSGVRIVGHADDADANATALSRSRADAVADALVAAGVDRSKFTVSGAGTTARAVPGRAGKPEAINRRVEVDLLP